ncbi:hypothetical protein [Cryobacterium cryoconiti]|uniref:Glycosyltransferase RgtA/B/C/D-like domain-containing protein n=1 Tax=Cryobacterium cryoconiti TaxID=1259239 RepID=A0A4Y8JU28_9MICO|nr:hypothetical protein [Cryobacterium cryoconiti]TFD30218.1 hypothetical protein E3T49_08385 [Cryobacterium cryoconiti]
MGNVLYGAVGLRGSDQYWYVADLLMSKFTDSPVTNAIYPTVAATASLTDLPPRIHNLPITHLAGLAHQSGVSDYLSWVSVNVFLAILIALCLYFVARIQGYSYSFIAPAVFLTFPLTLWLSINALAEMSLALGASLLILGSVVASSIARAESRSISTGLLIMSAGSILMFYTRDNYALLLPAQALLTIWMCRKNRNRWLLAAPSLIITVVLVALKPLIFPPYAHAGVLSQLMAGTPSEKGQMTSYYDLAQAPFSLSEFVSKVGMGLAEAIVPSSPSEVITESAVLLVVVAGISLIRNNQSSRMVKYWALVVLGIYLASSAAFQAQNRYIFALVPFVAVFAVGLIDQLKQHKRATGWVSVVAWVAVGSILIGCAAGSFLMAREYKYQAQTEIEQTRKLGGELAREPSGSVLAVADTSQVLPLTYAAVPRPVIALNPLISSPEEAARLIEDWDVRILVGASKAHLEYLSLAVDLAFDGRATLITRPTYEAPGGPIQVWVIEP